MNEPAFELEQFRWTADDRLELTGRWTGVRGVLFVRPTLVLVAGQEHRRLLALLEGKPWAAPAGRPWTVVFPWDGDRLDAEAAELSVAPGIVVALPPPDSAGSAARPPGVREAAEPRAVTRRSRGILQRAADGERAEAELDRERAARQAAERERDVLRRERDVLRRERDVLRRDRDEAALARDAAVRERDAALVVRDRLERERAGLMAGRDALRRERDEAVRRTTP